MGKKKCPECPKCLPGWLVQFGDLMSLLLVFFILILSMSSLDTEKVKEAIGSLAGAMSVLEGGMQTEVSIKRIQKATPIETTTETAEEVNKVVNLVSDINEIIRTQGGGETVSVEETQEGFMIKLPAGLLFKPGSATIENDDAILFLKRVALMVNKMPNSMEVVVRGHTDDSGLPRTSIFKDNWELSTARAVSVTKELIKERVKGERLSAAGHAQYRPVATNATPQGRARNRRVELHFLSRKKEDKGPTKRSVLDQQVSE